MKYLILILVCIPTISGSSELNLSKKEKILNRYSWMSKKLYNLYQKRSKQYNVPIKLAISVIKAESNGKVVKSRKNKNGTRDWGRFQINAVHMPNNPKKLLDDKINSKYGFWYLSLCLKKSKGYLKHAIRMYNQGLAGKEYKYKNWQYVNNVLKEYRIIF